MFTRCSAKGVMNPPSSDLSFLLFFYLFIIPFFLSNLFSQSYALTVIDYQSQNSNPDLMCIYGVTSKMDFGKKSRGVAWAAEQRTLHGLQSVEGKMFSEKSTFRDINLMAEEAKRRAEIARLRELHTLKGKVESFAKLDIDAINQNYTV